MHELSIANDIFDIVTQYLPDSKTKVNSIKVRIGKLTNVLNDSLRFCFGAIIDKTPLEGAKLDIELVPVRVKCNDCGNIDIIEEFVFQCTNCRSRNIKMIGGDELQVVEIELKD